MVRALLIGGLSLALLAGCGVAPGATVRVAQRPAVQADAELQRDVVTGFRQIFKTYDAAPRDERLSFAEFGHVVLRAWFDEHDTNHDGVILFDEWLTPTELAAQVADIVATGKALVAKADRDGDRQLTLEEYLAYASFEVDATPWLAGPADPAIKTHGFQRHAPAGKLDADRAARMVGELLAQGYYLDDASEQRASAWLHRP